jgi:hypothetical protein
MFESILSMAIPFCKDLLLTLAAGLFAYAMTRLQSYIQSF